METFDEYEAFTDSVTIYPNAKEDFLYPLLGLNGEAGEVADKLKKIIREDYELTKNVKRDIVLELGDVFYYFTRICMVLNLKLKDVCYRFNTFDEFDKYVKVYNMAHPSLLYCNIYYLSLKINYFAGLISNIMLFEDIKSFSLKSSILDFIFYFVRCCQELDISLKEVINCNVSKLQYRCETDKVKGSGDHR